MKKILLIGLVIIAIGACTGDDDFTNENARLEGYWLLTEITGGIAGTGYEASFDHLQINEGQRYSLMVQDALIQEGTYQLTEEEDQRMIHFIPSSADTITFDNEVKTITFNEEENLLTLTDPCCDLYIYSFTRDE